jgi:hypothetical protein
MEQVLRLPQKLLKKIQSFLEQFSLLLKRLKRPGERPYRFNAIFAMKMQLPQPSQKQLINLAG